MSKSAMMKRYAKKHGIPVINLKMKRAKADDYRGLLWPTPRNWVVLDECLNNRSNKAIDEEMNAYLRKCGVQVGSSLWFWEV